MDWMGSENDLNIETWEIFKVRSISRCIISSQKGLMKERFDKYDSGSLKIEMVAFTGRMLLMCVSLNIPTLQGTDTPIEQEKPWNWHLDVSSWGSCVQYIYKLHLQATLAGPLMIFFEGSGIFLCGSFPISISLLKTKNMAEICWNPATRIGKK